ncbi:MAG TPA: spermidine synthase [Thermoanaerobaculia bacterium]
MLPWTLLGEATLPGSSELMRLYRRGGEYAIRVGTQELMNSRVHASEDALGALACERLDARKIRVLIGGLGMGYTLAATLACAGREAEVVVGELVPAVVEWNRGPLADLAGRPLDDPRVVVRVEDVVDIIRSERGGFDAILLDVDNGPSAFTTSTNNRLYSMTGLRAAHAALRPGGIYAVWSSGGDAAFTRKLQQAGFTSAEEVRVRGRTATKGSRFLIWVAQKAKER